MIIRGFTAGSRLTDDRLALELAPALTPTGLVERPSFFEGFVARPQVLARGLVTLADITATRYFTYTPESLRDPVLTAHGDRLRAECFSACNGLYARLDLLPDGFDTGEIGRGTTNVDIGPDLRRLLTGVGAGTLLHLAVGDDGLGVSTPTDQRVQRPVVMPSRWVRALGQAAELHHSLSPAFTLHRAAARRFVGSLPSATATQHSGWLTPHPRDGATLRPRRTTGAVYVAGLHRWSALRRLLTHVEAITVHGPSDDVAADRVAAVEVSLPGARFTLLTTAEAWRGFSGEGSLLAGLADSTDRGNRGEITELVSAGLAFEPVVEVDRLARLTDTTVTGVRGALSELASSGILGWDAHDGAWFHRELPHDPARVDRDHPRLRRARRIVDAGQVVATDDGWDVGPAEAPHRVRLGRGERSVDDARCTCAWYLRHRGGRGPCAHVLATHLVTRPSTSMAHR